MRIYRSEAAGDHVSLDGIVFLQIQQSREGSMPDQFVTMPLNGHATTFLRFFDSDKVAIEVNGAERTSSRALRLPEACKVEEPLKATLTG